MKPGDRLWAVAHERATEKAVLAEFVRGQAVKTDPVEIVEKRTMNGKHFDLGDGFFHSSQRIAIVHWKNDFEDEQEPWQEVDLTISDTGEMGQAFYDIAFRSDVVGYTYTSKRGPQTVIELAEIGGAVPDYSAMKAKANGDRWEWSDVAPGVDMYAIVRGGYAELFKVIKDDQAAREFVWKVNEADDDNPQRKAHFQRATEGKEDASGDKIELLNAVEAETKKGLRREFLFRETWTGKVARVVDPVTRRKEFRTNPVFPVVVDATVTENIPSDNDDGAGYTAGTGWYASLSWIGKKLGNYDLGLRFTTVAVAQGSTINSATLTVNVQTDGGASAAGTLFGVKVANPGAWASGSNVPKNATRTTASLSFNATATGLKVCDVTTIVQEIVNQATFASGNAMGIVGITANSSGNYAILEDYSDAGTDEAQLDITYAAGGGGGVTVKPLSALGVG